MTRTVTTGIVLARTNFGEADRILTVITPDHGRIRVMAKGVRKVKSKLAGGIELFSVSHITFIKGKGDIDTLISSRLKQHFGQIIKDIDRTMFGYKVLKLINKTIEDNVGEEYFNLLERTLESLDNPGLNQDLIELWLNLQLLKLAGHAPNLQTDASGGKLAEDEIYDFDFDKMCFSASANGPYKAQHIKLMRLAQRLISPKRLNTLKNFEQTLASCLQLSASMIKHHTDTNI